MLRRVNSFSKSHSCFLVAIRVFLTSTPLGAGDVTFCTGSDYYKFNYNWVCGNLSSDDGVVVAQLVFSYYSGNRTGTLPG